jgi:hypothetical protein
MHFLLSVLRCQVVRVLQAVERVLVFIGITNTFSRISSRELPMRPPSGAGVRIAEMVDG